MGRRGQNKNQKANKNNFTSATCQKNKEGNLKLSPQKKSELNKVIEKLLRITSTLGIPNNGTKIFETHLEVDKLLHKVISIEDEINSDLPERSKESIENLTKWMLENGAKIKGIEIAEFEDYGYGLKATKDVKESDFMISVPRKLMMTTDLARQSELEYLVRNDTLLMHMPNIILALYLLLEKFKVSSFWEPYIKALPQSYTTVMYFTPPQLEALKGSPIYESALKQCKSIARQYGYLYNLFQKSADPASEILRDVFTYKQYSIPPFESLERLVTSMGLEVNSTKTKYMRTKTLPRDKDRWAVSTVMTRQNLIPTIKPENPMILALIPYWDMGNHDNAKLTTDYNVELDESEYYSCRDFTPGEQVFMSYGARANSEIFLHNGFVQVDNSADGVRLRLGVSRSDPLEEERRGLLADLGVPHSGEFLLPPGPVEGKLLAFLRVFNMEKEHLEYWMTNENRFDLLHPDCSVDTTVEHKMWQFLSTRIKLLLAAYPTSLEADEDMIKTNEELAACMKLAVLQRFTEKRILKSVLAYVEDHLKQ